LFLLRVLIGSAGGLGSITEIGALGKPGAFLVSATAFSELAFKRSDRDPAPIRTDYDSWQVAPLGRLMTAVLRSAEIVAAGDFDADGFAAVSRLGGKDTGF
jgi:hypothetical protein